MSEDSAKEDQIVLDVIHARRYDPNVKDMDHMTESERDALVAELEAAKAEQRRCMGGVDQEGCVAACRRITELRNALRNDKTLTEHFAHVLQHKER
jgi:hypothetical protein